MSIVLDALAARGESPALLSDDQGRLNGAEAIARITRLARVLRKNDSRCAAVTLGNGPDWVVADLACQAAGIPMVPVPGFFTAAQVRHVLDSAGADTLLAPGRSLADEFSLDLEIGLDFHAFRRSCAPPRLPPATARVTYTSGTTGAPKGVCLPQSAMEQVADSVAGILSGMSLSRHMVVLPLAVLLENVAGVYAGLLLGMEIMFPRAAETGLAGSSSFDPAALVSGIRRHGPQSLILLPQMLKALVTQLNRIGQRLEGLEFVAVGGARTAPELIRKARALGVPAYEGYGLTECSSVVAVNSPGHDRPGSVGRILPHQRVRLTREGEIQVGGDIRFSYAGEPAPTGEWLNTGDLGSIDEDGYLYISGRKQEALVTAFGRNVSPEWVESELTGQPGIDQAMVLGDDMPGLVALIAPTAGMSEQEIEEQVRTANGQLPDYARVAAWRPVPHFSAQNGQLTANGRPRRRNLQVFHSALIADLTREVETQKPGKIDEFLPITR